MTRYIHAIRTKWAGIEVAGGNGNLNDYEILANEAGVHQMNQTHPVQRRLRRIIFACFVIILLVVVLLACIPVWLSSNSGNSFMTKRVFGHWQAKVTAESFDLGWNRPLQIQNVSVEYQREKVLQIDSIQTDLTFSDLINRAGKFEVYRVQGVRLKLVDEGPHTNIEKIIPIDPSSNSRIEITNAQIELVNVDNVATATIADGQLAIEIKSQGQESTLSIEPTTLVSRSAMKLKLRPHLPRFLHVFLKEEYTEALVTTRLLFYSDKLNQSDGLVSKTELVIHEIRLGNPKLEAAVASLLREYTGQPAESQDIAVIHISRTGADEKFELISGNPHSVSTSHSGSTGNQDEQTAVSGDDEN